MIVAGDRGTLLGICQALDAVGITVGIEAGSIARAAINRAGLQDRLPLRSGALPLSGRRGRCFTGRGKSGPHLLAESATQPKVTRYDRKTATSQPNHPSPARTPVQPGTPLNDSATCHRTSQIQGFSTANP